MQATLARFDTTDGGMGHATVAFQPSSMPEVERFHVVRPHARGGLGKVSVARDAQLNREVALKELLDSHADNPASRARFLLEAEITGGLEHPGVVPVYGLGCYADGRPFYAMRFIRGDSLQQAIDRFHREATPGWDRPADVLQLRRLLARLIDVCDAVGYAHSRGVLHRDLKPGNVMLGQYGETLVVDWGLAKPRGEFSADPPGSAADVHSKEHAELPIKPTGSGSAPTLMGSAVGTPAFMSPEQAAGRLDELGPASDVYSLGATLYYLLTGRPPQTDGDLGIVLQRIGRGEFPLPRKLQSAAPRPLEAICLQAMSLRAAERYATPRAMAEDIESWLADEPVTALPEPLTTRLRRWVKKHRTLVASGAALLIAAAVSLGIGVALLSAANQRERLAKNRAVSEQRRAEVAEREAVRQSERNQQLLALARRSIEHYEKLSKDEVLQRYGMESLRTDLLQTAVDYYSTLAAQGGNNLQDRVDRAFAQYRLGMTLWGLGDVRNAEEALRRSLELRITLHKESPDNLDYAADAAGTAADLGELLSVNQRGEEAAPYLDQAIQDFKRLSAAHPERPQFLVQQAIAVTFEAERVRRFGQLGEAIELVEQANARYRQALNNVEGDEASFRQEIRLRIAQALLQLGSLEVAVWEFESSAERYDQAADILEQLRQEAPEAVAPRFTLARVRLQQAQLASRQNQIDVAQERLKAAAGLLTKLDEEYPDVLRFRRTDAEVRHLQCVIHDPAASNWMDEPRLERLQSVVKLAADLVKMYPDDADLKLSLARYQGTLGFAQAVRGNRELAEQQFAAARSGLQAHAALGAGNLESLFALAQQQVDLGKQLFDSGDAEGALESFDLAEQQWDEVLKLAPQLPEAHLSLAQIYLWRADIYLGYYRLLEGIAELDRLIDQSKRLSQFGDAAWINAGFNLMVAGAKLQRWESISYYRSQAFEELLAAGEYQLLANQLQGFAQLTGEAADHYVAARLLARAAGEVAMSETGSSDSSDGPDRTDALAERLAAAAVRELQSAWQAGYIRSSGG
ncbi:MAG: protein kinase, partial [Planctomycetota bacterium]